MKKLLAMLLAVLLLANGASAASDESAALTVSGIPVEKAEIYLYMLNAEREYAQIVEYYKTYLGLDYWSLEYANGMTVSQMVKSDVFKEILMMNVFYAMALEEGLSLTRAETDACRIDAEETYALLPVSYAKHIPASSLSSVLEKQRLADKMYSMLLSKTEIDEEKAAAGVDRDLYTTYEVEYLFRSATDFDENGRSAPLSAEKENEIRSAMESAKTLPALSECPPLFPHLNLHYAKTSFSENAGEIDPILIREVHRLQPGETGDVIKTDFGLFLIRLLDDTGNEAYEAAVDAALYAAREEAFSEEYNRLFMNAEYEINVSFWDTIMPGMTSDPD